MEANVVTQDHFYRRGLVLGLTLAEIAILVIFALLLVLGSMLRSKDQEIGHLKKAAVEAISDAEDLRAQVRELAIIAGVAQNNFDDLFVDLTLAIEEARGSQDVFTPLQERAKQAKAVEALIRKHNGPVDQQQAQEQTEWLTAQLSIAQSVQEVLIGDARSDESPKQKQKRVTEELAVLQQIQDDIQPSVLEKQGFVQRLRQMVRTGIELEAKNTNLQGQLRHIQRNLGKGAEHPPCWASRTGKPEYIFDTFLTDSGIIVTDNALPNRADAQQKLPLQEMLFDRELSQEVFLRISAPLFEWSEREGCRFFVRVYDRTGPHEKHLYKIRLRGVESRFYKWEAPSG